jgi:hypothetical protein
MPSLAAQILSPLLPPAQQILSEHLSAHQPPSPRLLRVLLILLGCLHLHLHLHLL